MTLPKLLLLILLAPELAHAQTSVPTFEVATIKPTGPSSDGHTHINYPPGDRFSATNITLLALMQWAYSMPERQILDGPPWLGSTRFDIQAKADTSDEIKGLTSEQDRDLKRRMVQALLADRFHLTLHQETRVRPAYDLILAKGGSKLQPTQSNGKSIGTGSTHFNGQGLTMTLIAEELSRITGRIVVDKTNLTDRYDLKLQWSPDDAPVTDNSAPSLFTAIQEQLGRPRNRSLCLSSTISSRLVPTKQKQRQRRLRRALVIPPIAKCAMDGAPVDRWQVGEEQTTAKTKCGGSSLRSE
jgi:uncharacterized protein (TIGR03435 family)